MMRKALGMIAVALLMATPTLADRATRTIHDVATIDNGSGRARILFRIGDLSELGPIVVKHATLRIPLSGDAVARSLDLRVHNLTTDWNPGSVDWSSGWTRPGGDLEDGVYGGTRVELSRGATTANVDVSSLLKDTYEMGIRSFGLLLTADTNYVDGLDTEDVSRFANLSAAVLDVDYLRVSRSPSRFLTEEGRRR
jgi:hypothetical protein